MIGGVRRMFERISIADRVDHGMRRGRSIALPVIALLCGSVVLAADVPKNLLWEAAFNRALNEPLTARFDEIELGTLFKTLGGERRIAFLLDRRIDPSREVSW